MVTDRIYGPAAKNKLPRKSLRRSLLWGGRYWDRTSDLMRVKHALSHLS